MTIFLLPSLNGIKVEIYSFKNEFRKNAQPVNNKSINYICLIFNYLNAFVALN